MPELFDYDGDRATPLFLALRDGMGCDETSDTLKQMWERYEPYADDGFVRDFALDPEARYWEMQLAIYWLDAELPLRRADQIPGRQNRGAPDLCIEADGHLIWIEATAPQRGQGDNSVPGHEGLAPGEVRVGRVPTEQVHLRITSALNTKRRKFETYMENGIVGEQDRTIIAINTGRFPLQAVPGPFPRAVTAVFPIGNEQIHINPETLEVVRQTFEFAPEIPRTDGPDIDRTAFLSEEYRSISGMIFSRASIGSVDQVVRRVLSFIHNPLARHGLEENWGPWDKEFVARRDGDNYTLSDIRNPLERE